MLPSALAPFLWALAGLVMMMLAQWSARKSHHPRPR
jgi:hypothetical protein